MPSAQLLLCPPLPPEFVRHMLTAASTTVKLCHHLWQVFEWQLCSDPKLDSHRFIDAIDAAIAQVRDVFRHVTCKLLEICSH